MDGKGAKGGTVIDDDGINDNDADGALDDKGGGNNGAENVEGEENINAIDESGEATDVDGGPKNPADGEDAGAVEGEEGENAEGAESGEAVEGDDRLSNVENTLAELRDAILPKKDGEEGEERPQVAQWKEPTEDEWKAHETNWDMPRKAIKRVVLNQNMLHERLVNYVDGQLAGLRKDTVLREISREKGFENIQRYRKGIDVFLKDYEPRHHANPALLKKAAIFAKGLMSGNDVRAAANRGERNRVVANKVRPNSPTNGNGGGVPVKLRPDQLQAARMLKGGVKEYLALNKKGMKTVE